MVKRMRMAGFWPFFATIIMVISTYSFPPQELHREQTKMEQFGGGGSLEEQCGSITFEDIFIYNQAIFEVRVNEDWKSAEVDAKAWINWSLADDIREDLDAFLEGIVPSGGDGWLSTDEIDAMVSIAADCLEYSITRIGIRDGAPHRGGTGVSWMNTTWEDDQTNIGHFNGVPSRHSQVRDCQGFSQDGCFEVPVIPDSERDCDIDINESLGADECRIELWLNATMLIDGISDPNDFTIAFNSSNMSNARLDFTFPVMPDLRMDMWEECEGRFVGPDEDNPRTDSAPIRGSCIGDGSANYVLKTNDDGSMTYSLNSNFSRENWPLGEDVFADFTTSSIPTDEAPTWTQEAPTNGTWIPIFEEGANKLASWEEIASWFDDESGVSNLDVVCNSGGNEISQSIDGSLWVNVDGVTEVSCEARDASGKSTGNRTWNLGVPVSISTPEVILQDQHPLKISHSDSWDGEVIVRLALSQGGQPSEIQEFYKGDSTQQVVSLNPQGIVPGPVNVWVEVLVGQFSFQHIVDLGIVKESSAPLFSFNTDYIGYEFGLGEFNGTMWRIGGKYSDPDGETVTFTIEIGGKEFGQVMVSGNTWESEWIDISHEALSLPSTWILIQVDITACDYSGKCTSEEVLVDIKSMMEDLSVPEAPDDSNEAGSSLPSTGIPALAIALSLALLFGRREELS